MKEKEGKKAEVHRKAYVIELTPKEAITSLLTTTNKRRENRRIS